MRISFLLYLDSPEQGIRVYLTQLSIAFSDGQRTDCKTINLS